MALAQSFEYKRHKLAYGECAYRTTGREFCGNENHPYEPYPALNDMNIGAPELSVRGGLMALLSGFIEERLMSSTCAKGFIGVDKLLITQLQATLGKGALSAILVVRNTD